MISVETHWRDLTYWTYSLNRFIEIQSTSCLRCSHGMEIDSYS